ncbi:alpha/beta fold hydrolase [Quadrisphaera sp. DSM 44207]|uniref:alpha/beta fold hydrolase n=1 Tax=Quadrisphaera sp. DSM 44207 TaxID=1881057 RepID=UPI002101471A|nr:alpha/beta hydrolase [Quadrisphaera sp. DSM 44207]
MPGPWRHRFVAANGNRFHVAESGPDDGSAPLVVLLHGFPQCWQAWEHQLPALAVAGYRAVAMDLRGYGASDKPPRGYDTPTLAADVAGTIRSLGASRAVVAGSGWGAWIAWSMPALEPASTAAVAALSAPHPLGLRRRGARDVVTSPAARLVASFQVPVLPERAVRDGSLVERVLTEWGAPGWPPPEVLRRSQEAMRVPFTAHAALEYYRWAVRSVGRRDGRAFAAAVARPVPVPVLQVHGGRDGAVPAALARGSASWAGDAYRFALVPGAGHFLPEEAPEETSALLLDWLAGLPR